MRRTQERSQRVEHRQKRWSWGGLTDSEGRTGTFALLSKNLLMEVKRTGLCGWLQDDVFFFWTKSCSLLTPMQKPLRSGLRQTTVPYSLFFPACLTPDQFQLWTDMVSNKKKKKKGYKNYGMPVTKQAAVLVCSFFFLFYRCQYNHFCGRFLVLVVVVIIKCWCILGSRCSRVWLSWIQLYLSVEINIFSRCRKPGDDPQQAMVAGTTPF